LKTFCVIAVTFGTNEDHIPLNALHLLEERLESLRIFNWTDLRRFRKDKSGRKKHLERWMNFALFKSVKVYTAWLNNSVKLS
jgi:hypothetical protein